MTQPLTIAALLCIVFVLVVPEIIIWLKKKFARRKSPVVFKGYHD